MCGMYYRGNSQGIPWKFLSWGTDGDFGRALKLLFSVNCISLMLFFSSFFSFRHFLFTISHPGSSWPLTTQPLQLSNSSQARLHSRCTDQQPTFVHVYKCMFKDSRVFCCHIHRSLWSDVVKRWSDASKQTTTDATRKSFNHILAFQVFLWLCAF